MKKFIKYYIDLMNKYILLKVGTILVFVMLLSQILTVINKTVNKHRINENPISKYNTYSTETLTVKDIANRYFTEYKQLLQYDIELAYELLEENCKNQYEDINDFKEHIKQNDFFNAEMTDYSVNEENGYKKYIIKDSLDNVYSFVIKNANEYNVILK